MEVATKRDAWINSDVESPWLQVGDVKNRLEKMHGIAFSLQRLMHQGRATWKKHGNPWVPQQQVKPYYGLSNVMRLPSTPIRGVSNRGVHRFRLSFVEMFCRKPKWFIAWPRAVRSCEIMKPCSRWPIASTRFICRCTSGRRLHGRLPAEIFRYLTCFDPKKRGWRIVTAVYTAMWCPQTL